MFNSPTSPLIVVLAIAGTAINRAVKTKAKPAKILIRFSSRYLDFTSKRGVSWYAYTEKISDSGIMGNPLLASAEKGKKIWEIMIAHLAALVEDLKQMSMEEIHQRRL